MWTWALRKMPWKTLLVHAPTIVDAARNFYATSRSPTTDGTSHGTPGNETERLRRAVEELHIVHDQAPIGIVTISVGVASLMPGKGQSVQQLLELADAGLYTAKRRGRNLVVAQAELTLSKAS